MQKRLLLFATLLLALCSKSMAAAQLTIGDVTLYNDVKKQVGVALTNDDAYVGFQFDLYLPDGISVDSLRGTGRLPDGTTPQMAQQADGSYRVIAAAMNANAITGNSGDVLTLVLSASGVAAGQYTAYMRNVKVSRADGSGDVVAEQPFTITVKDGEAYAVLDGTTLTFYYDKLMESRGGMTDWSNAATATSVVNFDASFASYQPTSTAGWFKDFTSLTAINGIEHLKTDAVTDMSSMFQGCESLTALDLSGFNTSEVTTMYNMFMSCRNLETLDVSTFNTVKVTDMSGMFSDCIKLTSLDLRYFQTANVETTMSMFYNCTALKTIYVGDGWNLENMPAGDYNTSSISMFENCNSIVGGAGTVYDMSHIDKEYARIDQPAAGLPGYLTSVADTITPATVTFSRDMYQLTMTCETANVNIMYAVVPDGSAAAPTWQQYGDPVTLTEDCTVRAYAERPSGLRSAETEYTFKMSDVSTVERPVMSWSGDDMSLTTSTEGATIYYTAEVEGTTPTIETYTAPVAITQDCVLSAWAAKTGLNNSDTLVVDYPYTAWQQLLSALGAAQTVAQQAQTSPRISDSMRGALVQLASEGQTMYNERTATEAEIIEKANHIYTVASDIQRIMDEVYEPYAVLSADSLTVTFYYDGQKQARGGMDINSSWIDTDAGNTSPYGSATTAVIDASFADYYPTRTAYWFIQCSNLTGIDGMANLKTDNVTNMRSMFSGCSGLTSLDVSGFNTANVTYMDGMFYGCSGLTSLDVSGFNTVNVTNMGWMFEGCSGLTSLDVSSFNTANVTGMRSMFSGCSGLTSLDVSGFNTANVTDMGFMFDGCSGLTSLDVSGFNTANVTIMYGMFSSCSGLTSLDVSGFNIANVTNMSYMFRGCSGLTSLDLSGFNTANVTDMTWMFWSCNSLKTIYVGEEWSTAKVTNSSDMFSGCTALVGGMGTVYDANHVDAAYAHIDGGTANPGYLTSVDAPSSYAVTLKAVGNGTVKAADITVASGDEQDIAVAPGASLTLAFTPDAGYRLENVTVDDTDVTSQVTVDSTGVSYYTLMSIYDAHTVTATFVNDTKEAYAVLSADGLTVTFYYDTQKTARGGMDINGGYVDASPYGSATTAVIDASFADYYPTSTAFWFCSCSNLTSIDGMVNLKTANVTDMSYMFYGCSGLTSLDVSGFNTANVTDMEFMFLGCSALTTIYVGEGWNTEKVTESTEMFIGCTALVGGAWTAYDNSYVEADYAHIDGGTANPGYLTSAADATVPAVVTYSRVGHTVTLSSATANVHIMYTLSTWPFADDEPQWQQYTDPLALTGDCTITAYAVRPSGLRSADTEYNFVLNANFVEAPTIARDGEENRVVITNNSTTGTVYYNYDANGQLTATNSSQYVGPIDVSQNVRINAAVIIDGVVSSDITSFTVDWFKVATPTYTWDADKLTATTTTDGASVEVSLTLPGDSVAAQVSGGVQTAIVTVEQDVRIDIRAMKDGWTDADVVSFDYPYTAWMQLMQAVDHGHQTMAAAAQSDKVDTVSPDAPYARLNALLIDAEEWYALRTAERLDIEELTARIQMTIAELEQEMNAVDEFAYDATNGVLHVYGNGLLEDALAAAGGREEVAKTLTAILWDKQQTLTDDMLQGLTGNPNLLIYVPGIEQAPVTVHNVVVGDRAEDILLVDATEGNSDFYCPRTFTADKISYTRNFTQKTQVGVTRGWESIVLPFTVQTITHESHGLLAPFGNDASTQHFWLRQLSPDGLERATEIVAYRPYLISMPNDSANYSAASCHAGRVTFTATDVDVMAATPQPAVLADETRRLIGTTRRVAAADDIYVLNVGQPDSTYLEGSVFVRNLRGVRPFECFTLHVGDGSRYISFDELSDKSTLGIAGTMYDGMKQEQWFTIDGRKLQRRPATKGVYILNGRKVVVK